MARGPDRSRSLALRRLVKSRGSDGTRIAAALGMNPSTVRARLNGQIPLDAENAKHQAFVRNVLREIGATDDDLAEAEEKRPVAPAVAPSRAIEPLDDLGELPYAGEIPAGEFTGELEDMGPIPVPARFCRRNRLLRYACRVTGSSCRPVLEQGDVAVFERDLAPASGLIVVAQERGTHRATVKLLEIGGDGEARLRALNPSHADPDGEAGWGAIGKLVGVWRVAGRRETIWHEDAGLRPRDFE